MSLSWQVCSFSLCLWFNLVYLGNDGVHSSFTGAQYKYYIYIYIPCKFNSCNQLQVFYPLNLSWNNEGTSLTWAWNCSLASCPINFEPLRGPWIQMAWIPNSLCNTFVKPYWLKLKVCTSVKSCLIWNPLWWCHNHKNCVFVQKHGELQ